ncbi:MAG TPA: (Fe-S)-binding protein [Spirochaetia bacterium]|nr:(Fe-S)-binding protein [Spirochaetia bacterium]
MRDLKEYEEEIYRCSQCNFCLALCPVYREDLVESSVARGRLNLIQAALLERTVPATGRVRELINRCLLCTNCVQGCPSGIPVDDIVRAARHELLKEHGPLWPEKLLFRQVLKRRPGASSAARAVTWLRRFNLLPGRIPPLADPPFAERVPCGSSRAGGGRARVAYFVGCGTNYLYPDTGAAVLKVLGENQVEVIIPEEQVCCGMPALAHGDFDAAAEAVRVNAGILASLDVDAVVTDCTSCGYMLRSKAAGVLPPDDPCLTQVLAVAGKTVEITEFIAGMGLNDIPASKPLTVTYHVPCHRSWSPGLVSAPERVISHLAGVQLVPLQEPERCCGAGGTFFLTHSALGEEIRERKLNDILKTGAQMVITQCPACRYYLTEGLKGRGSLQVVHPMVLLAGLPAPAE